MTIQQLKHTITIVALFILGGIYLGMQNGILPSQDDLAQLLVNGNVVAIQADEPNDYNPVNGKVTCILPNGQATPVKGVRIGKFGSNTGTGSWGKTYDTGTDGKWHHGTDGNARVYIISIANAQFLYNGQWYSYTGNMLDFRAINCQDPAAASSRTNAAAGCDSRRDDDGDQFSFCYQNYQGSGRNGYMCGAYHVNPNGVDWQAPSCKGMPTPICKQNFCNDTDLACPSGLTCNPTSHLCENPTCPDDADCTCPQPTCYQDTCNDTDLTCPTSLTCQSGTCVNADCSEATDCTCTYGCQELTGTVPARGENINLTCQGTGDVAESANFRLIRVFNDGSIQETGIGISSAALNAQGAAAWTSTTPIAVDFAAGTYKYQCQICNSIDQTCTEWGKGEIKSIQ